MSKEIIALTHKHGMRQIRNLPGVISAMHVQRKKYEINSEGKLESRPEYLIRVRVKRVDNTTFDREIILKGHPDNIGLREYNYIVKTIFGNGQ